MPIWLRNTTFKFIEEFYDNQKKAREKAQGKQKLESKNMPKGPDVRRSDFRSVKPKS